MKIVALGLDCGHMSTSSDYCPLVASMHEAGHCSDTSFGQRGTWPGRTAIYEHWHGKAQQAMAQRIQLVGLCLPHWLCAQAWDMILWTVVCGNLA